MSVQQRVEEFCAEGTVGARSGLGLQKLIENMNSLGYHADQIIYTRFSPSALSHSQGDLEARSGIVLFTKVADSVISDSPKLKPRTAVDV